MICGNFNATLVVLKSATRDFWRGVMNIETMVLEFFEQVYDMNHVTKAGSRQSNVFRFGGA
jgi:hypothetical protein